MNNSVHIFSDKETCTPLQNCYLCVQDFSSSMLERNMLNQALAQETA